MDAAGDDLLLPANFKSDTSANDPVEPQQVGSNDQFNRVLTTPNV